MACLYSVFEADIVSVPSILSVITEGPLLFHGRTAKGPSVIVWSDQLGSGCHQPGLRPTMPGQLEQGRPSDDGRQGQLRVQTTRQACGDRAGLRANWEVSPLVRIRSSDGDQGQTQLIPRQVHNNKRSVRSSWVVSHGLGPRSVGAIPRHRHGCCWTPVHL